jgi:hypothetical protein
VAVQVGEPVLQVSRLLTFGRWFRIGSMTANASSGRSLS